MLRYFFTLFLFVAAVSAQNAVVALPTANETVSPGNDIIVQVQRPNSLTGSDEVAVVIGLQSCPSSPCASPSSIMGIILYNGPFYPQYHEAYLPPYQNFTVQVPSTVPEGAASIGVVHITLIGAGMYPALETLSKAITIT